jgi:CAAX prenyl protease-like protein
MTVWLLFRVIGSVVTVPLAEELLFRGYLLAKFARQQIMLEGRIAFSWVALILSSILFGLLHANWIAGIVAGLIFGLVRYRGDSVKDAVIAHASANLLLSVYVISSGSWSLW